MEPSDISANLPEHLILGDKIGEGGFAAVYRLHNRRLRTDWAIKVMLQGRMSSRDGISKALKEAQITAQLKHPNVVTIHDVDEDNGFIFMELVSGPPLTDVLRGGIRSRTQFEAIAGGILAGLAAAHHQRIIHADISPRNILLTESLIPKLVDFGLARHGDFSSSSIGMTPGFASPEHVLNKKLTTQSDVFSIGAVLYLLATGTHPFEWENHYAYSYAILNEKPAEPRFQFNGAPSSLATLLLRALATEPGKRYKSAVEMARAFTAPSSQPRLTTDGQSRAISVSQSAKALRHYSRGLEYYQGTSRQEMDWAEAEFRSALECDPKFALAYAGLADVTIFRYMSYFEHSEASLARAEHYCKLALGLDPEQPQIYRALGRVCMERREFDRAREHFAHAIDLDPDYMAAHMSLAWCAVGAQDMKEAERAASVALAIDNEDMETILLLSRVYYYQKEYDRSINMANDAIRINRKSGRAYYDLAMAHRALGDFEKARRNFGLSIEYHGDPNAPIDLGILALLERDFDRAEEAFVRASEDDTFAFLSQYYLGFVRFLQGQAGQSAGHFRQSLRLCEELAKRDSREPYPKAIAAMALAAISEFDRSREQLSSARQIDPDDGLLAYYAACARSWMDDATEVRELLDEAQRLPRSPSPIEVSLDPHFAGRS